MAYSNELERIHNIINEISVKRKELGISHDKLAIAAKLNRSAISLIENHKRIPTLLTIMKICDALGISLGEIILRYEKS
jgi:transcriptional regulator with XRE-family HTH domain